MKRHTVSPRRAHLDRDSLLITAKIGELERIKQSARNCQDENHPEYKIYSSFVFANLSRYQLAAEVIREALAAVRANPQLHRHKIKQQCKVVRASIERYDCEVARASSDLDLFDEVTERTTKSVQFLLTPAVYSVQQIMLTNDIKNTHECALLEVAVALLQECESMHQGDIDHYKAQCPWILGMQFGSDIIDLKTLRSVRQMVFDVSVPADAKVNLNEDKNIKTAWDNLINTISRGKIFHDAIGNLVEV